MLGIAKVGRRGNAKFSWFKFTLMGLLTSWGTICMLFQSLFRVIKRVELRVRSATCVSKD